MMNKLKYSLLALLAVMLVACNGSGNTEGAQAQAATDTTQQAAAPDTSSATKAPEKVETVKAKFVSFELGDASHFTFANEKGEELDFGGCEDKNYEFALELPQKESNETNQGWGSNKKLQNKWFELKYVTRKQPLYIDGPEGDVMVILEAKEVAK